MITTITGKNTFAISQKLRELKDTFISEHGAEGVVELDGDELAFSELQQHVLSQGLFSQANLVVVRDFAKNKSLIESLGEKLDSIPDDAQLVLVDAGLDRRTSFFKSLQKQTNFVDCAVMEERELVAWAREQLEGLEFGAAQHLVQRVNGDQWLLFNELEKLKLVDGELTKDVIDGMVDESFSETIFNLLDLAFGKNADRALNMYRDMLKNQIDAYYVFSMLVWQLHALIVVSLAGDRTPEQIAKDNGLSPFVVKKTMGVFRKTSRRELREIIDLAADIDRDSKSKGGYDMEAAVDLLIARIAG